MIDHTESRSIRYEMRNEIETIIKTRHIDRTKFHETSKNNHEKVIRKLYYSFCNYQKYPTIQLAYLWTRFRDNLNQSELISTNWKNWDEYINKIDLLIPEKDPCILYYFIVDGGWVYEGRLQEIKTVLSDYPMFMEDFYIFPKNYDWLLCHCDDGGCMIRLWK